MIKNEPIIILLLAALALLPNDVYAEVVNEYSLKSYQAIELMKERNFLRWKKYVMNL